MRCRLPAAQTADVLSHVSSRLDGQRGGATDVAVGGSESLEELLPPPTPPSSPPAAAPPSACAGTCGSKRTDGVVPSDLERLSPGSATAAGVAAASPPPRADASARPMAEEEGSRETKPIVEEEGSREMTTPDEEASQKRLGRESCRETIGRPPGVRSTLDDLLTHETSARRAVRESRGLGGW